MRFSYANEGVKNRSYTCCRLAVGDEVYIVADGIGVIKLLIKEIKFRENQVIYIAIGDYYNGCGGIYHYFKEFDYAEINKSVYTHREYI